MSDDIGSEVEKITETPLQESVKKENDPKKVAAGKKLAEHNRRAKEALKREMKREAEKEEERETGESQACSRRGWFPELSFTTAVSLVGIGLTTINMFMSYRTPKVVSEPPPAIASGAGASKIPIPITPKIGIFSLNINVEREDLQDCR